MLRKHDYYGRLHLLKSYVRSYFYRQIFARGSSISLKDNLVAYYDFETLPGEDVPDIHKNASALVDNNCVARTRGKHGRAADMDIEKNQYYSIPGALGAEFEFAGSFSVVFWMKIVSPPSKANGKYCYQVLFQRRGKGGGFAIYNAAIASSVAWILYSSENSWKVVHNLYGVGDWRFYCVVNDARNKLLRVWSPFQRIMVDVTEPYDFDQGTTKVDAIIGASHENAEKGHMLLDSLAFFDKALSALEIEWLFNKNRGRTYSEY